MTSDDSDRAVIYRYSKPERSSRWVAIYTLHEARRHLFDIRRQVGPELRQRRSSSRVT